MAAQITHTRRLLSPWLARLAMFTLIALLIAACAVPATPAPVKEPEAAQPTPALRTLIVAISEDTVSLDPARAFETLPAIVHKATYETLVTFPPDSVDRIEPGLAESWTISEDGLVYMFKLRQGVKFHSGNTLTAKDVVFSFNRMKNIKGNPSFLAETIAKVEAQGDDTVVLTLTRPDPAILAKLVFSAFAVLDSETVKAHGGTDAEDAAQTDKAEEWLNNNSAGTGPFVLKGWTRQVETVLEAFPDYWRGPAALDRVIFRNMPEAAAQKIALEAGDIDIAMDISPDQVPSLKANPQIEVFEDLSDTIVFLIMNQDPALTGGIMSDPLVQKAVRLALDYDGLRALAGGAAVNPASVIPVGFLGAYGPDRALKRDLEAAKALLAEAGYPDGFEIELEYPDFTFGGINFGTFAQKIQADLAEAGIRVILKPAEVQVALQNYRDGKEGFGLWLWLPDYRDSLDYVEFLPEGVVGKRVNWRDDNADETIKALRDQVLVETDDEVRAELFRQIQDYLQEKGPYAPFLQPGVQIGVRVGVKGFAYNPQWRIDPYTMAK